MAVKYVDNFEFSSGAGFTGSAGKQPVKGYMRGGAVKRPSPVTKHVGGPSPAKEYPASKAHQKMPPKIEKAISSHEALKVHGRKMGFAYGGQVKTTGMDSMDSGVQPAREGRNQADIEAGGTKRMKPGFAEGGKTKDKKSPPKAPPASRLGTGVAAVAAKGLKEHEARIHSTADDAVNEMRKSMGLPPLAQNARGGPVAMKKGGMKGRKNSPTVC